MKKLPDDSDKHLKYRAQMAIARCAIKRRVGQAAVNALLALRPEYPKDPEVLYLTTQVFLEIAVRASQELTALAPNSYQVLELEAETLDLQSKWQEAAAIYRKIPGEEPEAANIHFRPGRVVLAQPETPATTEDDGVVRKTGLQGWRTSAAHLQGRRRKLSFGSRPTCRARLQEQD